MNARRAAKSAQNQRFRSRTRDPSRYIRQNLKLDLSSAIKALCMKISWPSVRNQLDSAPSRRDPRRAGQGGAQSTLVSSFLEDGDDGRHPDPILDTIGHQDRVIRDHIEHMVDRLDEIRNLKDDFAVLVEPMLSLLVSQPLLRSRLAETETMLRQERETVSALTRQTGELMRSNTRLSDDLLDASSQLMKQEVALHEHESQLDELRSLYNERGLQIGNLEKQVAADAERAEAMQEGNTALREAAQQADQAVARTERDLVEARERIELLEHENESLRKSSGEQTQRIASLTSRQSELEHQLEEARQLAAEVEARLTAEQAARQKVEAQRDQERVAAEAQAANLEMRVEGLTARMAANDKIVSTLRDQLREKNEALLGSERSLTEVVIEKQTAERISASLQQEVERQAAQIASLEKAGTDLSERLETTSRALSARDAVVENADARAAKLAERIEQLTRQFGHERSDLEAANRTLLEQLQDERSERALAQGALEISRESRAKIQRQLSAMRMSRGAGGAPAIEYNDAGDDMSDDIEPRADRD